MSNESLHKWMKERNLNLEISTDDHNRYYEIYHNSNMIFIDRTSRYSYLHIDVYKICMDYLYEVRERKLNDLGI